MSKLVNTQIWRQQMLHQTCLPRICQKTGICHSGHATLEMEMVLVSCTVEMDKWCLCMCARWCSVGYMRTKRTHLHIYLVMPSSTTVLVKIASTPEAYEFVYSERRSTSRDHTQTKRAQPYHAFDDGFDIEIVTCRAHIKLVSKT